MVPLGNLKHPEIAAVAVTIACETCLWHPGPTISLLCQRPSNSVPGSHMWSVPGSESSPRIFGSLKSKQMSWVLLKFSQMGNIWLGSFSSDPEVLVLNSLDRLRFGIGQRYGTGCWCLIHTLYFEYRYGIHHTAELQPGMVHHLANERFRALQVRCRGIDPEQQTLN